MVEADVARADAVGGQQALGDVAVDTAPRDPIHLGGLGGGDELAGHRWTFRGRNEIGVPRVTSHRWRPIPCRTHCGYWTRLSARVCHPVPGVQATALTVPASVRVHSVCASRESPYPTAASRPRPTDHPVRSQSAVGCNGCVKLLQTERADLQFLRVPSQLDATNVERDGFKIRPVSVRVRLGAPLHCLSRRSRRVLRSRLGRSPRRPGGWETHGAETGEVPRNASRTA
jgi:hypothetical protein